MNLILILVDKKPKPGQKISTESVSTESADENEVAEIPAIKTPEMCIWCMIGLQTIINIMYILEHFQFFDDT